MFVHPPTVGATADKPLLSVIEQEAAVLEKYGAISTRVAGTLAVNAAQQWSTWLVVGGLIVGAVGVLGLQWIGTGLFGFVKDATTDPTAIVEKIVNKLQQARTEKKK